LAAPKQPWRGSRHATPPVFDGLPGSAYFLIEWRPDPPNRDYLPPLQPARAGNPAELLALPANDAAVHESSRFRGRDCAIRSQRTGNQFRSVSRFENEVVLDRMQAGIVQRPDILDQRRETVEHPFGSIKQWMNQGAFLMRGLEKVRGEFSLTALAYNLRRVLNIMELPKLIAALPA